MKSFGWTNGKQWQDTAPVFEAIGWYRVFIPDTPDTSWIGFEVCGYWQNGEVFDTPQYSACITIWRVAVEKPTSAKDCRPPNLEDLQEQCRVASETIELMQSKAIAHYQAADGLFDNLHDRLRKLEKWIEVVARTLSLGDPNSVGRG
jgi:hypothetical protein